MTANDIYTHLMADNSLHKRYDKTAATVRATTTYKHFARIIALTLGHDSRYPSLQDVTSWAKSYLLNIELQAGYKPAATATL